VLTAGLACIPAIVIKLHAGFGPSLALGAIAVSLVATFALLGTVTRQIKREDWRFLGRWVSGGFARS